MSSSSPSTGARGPSGVRRPTTPGTRTGRPTDRGSYGTSGTSPICHGTRRAIIVRDDTGAAKVVAGGDAIGVGQPRFAPTGERLAFVSDADGWPVVWTSDPDGGNAQPVLREDHEHAEPAWGPGQRSYAWSPDGTQIAWCRNEGGFGRLVIGSPGTRSARELSKGWHRGLDWNARGIACVRTGAVTPGQVVVLAANGSGRRSIARGPVGGFEATPLVEPRAVQFKSSSANVHGLLYRPIATRPPLVVHLHGGPTGQALADWNARVQWLVARGCAVLQPNYRGSSGYGRAVHAGAGGALGRPRRRRYRRRYPPRRQGRLVRSESDRADGWQRRRLHRVARRGEAPGSGPRCHRALPGHRSARPRGDDPPLRVRLPPSPRRSAARRRGPLSRTLTADARRRDPRAGPPAARVGRSIRAPRAVGAPRGARPRTANGTCTKARGTAGAGSRPLPTSSPASTPSSRSDAARVTVANLSIRGRSGARIARCCSRTVPAPTCTRRR